MEPENNIEMILKGFLHSKKERDLVIIEKTKIALQVNIYLINIKIRKLNI